MGADKVVQTADRPLAIDRPLVVVAGTQENASGSGWRS